MPDSFGQLRSALADRYAIERELGRGGNAVVYLARDVKHGRRVAIKVLHPELALAVRAERFNREIEIASRLSHPHILSLYDSGAADGLLFYVMPYVEGESLRERLKREKQLPLNDSMRITREVAQALAYAHKQGVIHRDIKPENILLHEGHALVADFGMARALTAAAGDTVTESGIAVGTPSYMSPEQATGTVDGRSDIYSLGCVLYEMLAGHPPFNGSTSQEILARHALDDIPRLKAARHAVPASVEVAVRKALAKQPADRPATANEFLSLLDAPDATVRETRRPQATRVLGIAAVLVLAVAGGLRSRLGSRERAVAVLPFTNLSSEPESDLLSQGMTEELGSRLAEVANLRAFLIRVKTDDPIATGRQQGAGYVLEGSVRQAGTHLRVTARLTKIADGSQALAQSFDVGLQGVNDVLTVEDSIARSIVRVVRGRLGLAEPLSPSSGTSLAAYQLYLKGRAAAGRATQDGFRAALDYFNEAIAKDSTYAVAWAWKALTYQRMYPTQYITWDEMAVPTEQAAYRALALDSSLAEAHLAVGSVLLLMKRQWKQGIAEFRRATRLNPSIPEAHSSLGLHLAAARVDLDEAVREGEIAVNLDPLSPYAHNVFANTLRLVGRYDRSLEETQKAAQLEPSSSQNHQRLGAAYREMGLYQDALREFLIFDSIMGPRRRAVSMGRIAQTYAAAGDTSSARAIGREIENGKYEGTDLGGFPFTMVNLYALLGDNEKTFRWMEISYQRHSWNMLEIPAHSRYWPDRIRRDPRLAEFIARMGFDPPQ